jgi:hypothetical protein
MSDSENEPWLEVQNDLHEFVEGVLAEMDIDEDEHKAREYAHQYFSIDQADNGVWYARWKGHDERLTFDSNDEEKLKNILALNMKTKP